MLTKNRNNVCFDTLCILLIFFHFLESLYAFCGDKSNFDQSTDNRLWYENGHIIKSCEKENNSIELNLKCVSYVTTMWIWLFFFPFLLFCRLWMELICPHFKWYFFSEWNGNFQSLLNMFYTWFCHYVLLNGMESRSFPGGVDY